MTEALPFPAAASNAAVAARLTSKSINNDSNGKRVPFLRKLGQNLNGFAPDSPLSILQARLHNLNCSFATLDPKPARACNAATRWFTSLSLTNACNTRWKDSINVTDNVRKE
eukprot:CAMPEP_0115358644 /NCGR_PEP_ID=MMETSP0270-20121206/100767_1 /TAXON_ID=71861 /ORGANISM="Scrippsiella trochoidea, Strain CCMP3099" /LENGTH=111 /DNA_ID=CAMNT_0002781133 /DNA_START=215 /DNA_END=551 /DNA_ORIENTATION=-